MTISECEGWKSIRDFGLLTLELEIVHTLIASLEQLLLLLAEPGISLDSKEKVLSNLQEGILMCADGTESNILSTEEGRVYTKK